MVRLVTQAYRVPNPLRLVHPLQGIIRDWLRNVATRHYKLVQIDGNALPLLPLPFSNHTSKKNMMMMTPSTTMLILVSVGVARAQVTDNYLDRTPYFSVNQLGLLIGEGIQ